MADVNVVQATEIRNVQDIETKSYVAEETAVDEQTEVFTIPTESIWNSENFHVKHSITNYWKGGCQGEVVITNIGDTTIEDWNLMFETANRYSTSDRNIGNAEDYQYTAITDENGEFSLAVTPGTYRIVLYNVNHEPFVIEELSMHWMAQPFVMLVLMYAVAGITIQEMY